MRDRKAIPAATDSPSAISSSEQATLLSLQYAGCGRRSAFTLVELLVTVGVLVLLVLLFTQMLNSAAGVTTLGHKRMDADSQARQLFDRMAVDFGQLIKRSDVSYYLKGGTGGAQTGNDQIAFYCAVPGYYSTTASTAQSPVSVVAYHVSTQNKTERLGKGLLWNGVSSTEAPLTFWQAIAAPTGADYTTFGEIIGPEAFRFEYCYLLTNGSLSITPPTDISTLAAIGVDIAVIDPKSKVLLSNALITSLAGQLSDYTLGMTPGQLRASWRTAIDANSIGLPRAAISGIRVYERFFYLSPPTL
jgi:hypothetical protein